MALLECKECGKQVSSEANACPHCGAPVKKEAIKESVPLSKKKVSAKTGCLVIFGLFMMMSMCAGIFGESPSSKTPTSKTPSRPSTSWKTEDNSSMAYIMMEDFVQKRLKSSSTAEFPGVFDGKLDHVRYLENQTYQIKSWVDSQNGFGATIRTGFNGKIKQVSANEWQLLELTFSN